MQRTDKAFSDFEDCLTVEVVDKLYKLYNIDLQANFEDDATTDFICNTTIYKLIALIHEVAYFKFVLNRKHAYEENKFIYCQDCQDYNLNK